MPGEHEPQRKTITPWGPSRVLDEVTIARRAGDKRFHCSIQLLQGDRGDRLVRVAYGTDGPVRRGPVTLRRSDLVRLRAALADHPELAAELRPIGGGA
jgi:hypothetical protein